MRRKLAVAGAVLAVMALAAPAYAQDAEVTAESVQANLDVIFLGIAAALVFFMQAGFAMLECGFVRSRNAANIVMKNLMDFCVGGLAYFAVGFAIMYGAQVAGLFGTDGFFLTGFSAYEPVTGGSLEIDFLYQVVFAATAATIVSGGVAERMKFSGYLLMSLTMTALIYPVIGAWKWGGGWLDALGFYDFAGSTVVHLTGGVAALTGALILGPRLGKFVGGKANAIPGHSVPFAVLGTLILFLGWFGFNGGSVLAADGAAVAAVWLTTLLAGCAGGLAATGYTWRRFGKPDVGMACNGVLAGLVGITAGADRVDNFGAIGIGLVCGVVVVMSVVLIDRLRIDDPVGAFSVHGTCGALGTIWVGLAATGVAGDGAYGAGLFYGGGLGALVDQVVGVLAATAWVAGASAVVFLAIKATVGLRVSETEELEGLDIHEHGMYGYPELALGTQAFPGGPRTASTGVVAGQQATDQRRAVLQE
ncbi:MAG TPA: ammonium transporter [Egibacteraceae bacterium]|nr:ammonium transporter [Egibacteraceae bacterium]